jgi:hypothetical protein
MSMRSWIRRFFNRPVARTIRKAPNRSRLTMEILEARCLLSTFTVTNTRDDGSAGTLRWAIAQANGASEASTIDFDPKVFDTITPQRAVIVELATYCAQASTILP